MEIQKQYLRVARTKQAKNVISCFRDSTLYSFALGLMFSGLNVLWSYSLFARKHKQRKLKWVLCLCMCFCICVIEHCFSLVLAKLLSDCSTFTLVVCETSVVSVLFYYLLKVTLKRRNIYKEFIGILVLKQNKRWGCVCVS